jgi:Zn-dependent protease with chaperone function
MVSAAKVGHFKANHVAVNKLMGFFKLNLVFGVVAHFNGTGKRSFAFRFQNIIAMVGFIY